MMDRPQRRASSRRATLVVGACIAIAIGTVASANDGVSGPPAWIGTWAASPQPVWGPDFFAPVNIPRAIRNQTVRQVAAISVGGSKVRVVLSNEYGTQALVVGAAHVALSQADPAKAMGSAAIVGGSDHALTFGGGPSITVPPGAPAISDPVDFNVSPQASLAVSVFLPQQTPLMTFHWEGVQTGYISSEGDVSGAADFKPAETMKARLFLSEILVDAPTDARAIVTFGDSITDGANSTVDADHRWPDFLAGRLLKAGFNHISVVNEGISGARVLRDRMGDNALARFDRDVLAQPRADTVVLMMGINDIGWPDTVLVPPGEPAPSPEAIIAGYQQLITRAHDHGMRIIGATLTPFEDTFKGGPLEGYYSEAKEQKRQAVNAWIRAPGHFDAVIDFDAAARDPNRPKHILAAFDSGDHLHPQDDGYRAMADSIDLNLLTKH